MFNNVVNGLDDFAGAHPYFVQVCAATVSTCLWGGIGYLYGRLANVSASSCAKILVISNFIKQMALLLDISSAKDIRDKKEWSDLIIKHMLFSAIISAGTLGLLGGSKLIGPIGAIAYIASTILLQAFQVVLLLRNT